MNTDPTPTDKDAIAANIERTVDKAALRKVRGLVDELEAEDTLWRRQQKWIIAGGAAITLAAFTWITVAKQKDAAAEARQACELNEWQQRVAALRAEIKVGNPAITHVELQRQIDGYRQQLQSAASRACASR
ncbi:MAG: hypothetical protein JNM76_01515 [Betaproteobacteria bacterium]|nr:hypothetical protein [Betaproteobacteria bacterium]